MISEQDYLYAIVRLATHFDRKKSEARLLFASVEMLPRPFPEPESGRLERRGIKGVVGGTAFFRRVAMTGDQALLWYGAAAGGNAFTPVPAKPADRLEQDGGPLLVNSLSADLPWPELGLFVGAERVEDGMRYELPFLSDWHDQPRVHRSLSSPDPRLEAIAADPGTRAWLAERTFVDFGTHPEWIGGLAMVAPNPVWHRLERRRLPPADNVGEGRTLVNIVPRPGASIAGVEITSFQERAGLATRLEQQCLEGTRTFAVFGHGGRNHAEGLLITCPQRGMLYWSKPAAFASTLTLSSSIVGGARRYSSPVGRGAAASVDAFDVTDVVDEVTVVGDPVTPRDGLVAGAARRGRQAAAQRLGQRWFADDHGNAAAFLRSLIGAARKSVGIYDPYVTGLELFRFAHAVTRASVQVRILTSAMPFHQTDKSVETERLDELEREVVRLEAARGSPERAKVKVLRGDPPPLHDRFLVVDDNVWFTGNSLGSLGGRAGMIIRLPDPDPVIEELAGLFDKAEEVGVFLARRRMAITPADATRDGDS
ncbi:VPA1262 family N-terminal domain-containing protein [Lichenihabitans sp. Uapishka_5]|uniref:VPA1262 family N-terminal domain-containing protein n=1 Tax=Lichenihabitans sp. Uapishka_5 TaxID=3037302 RepID=UPI0029E814CE|nr:VPA1262 family N-terminal domain-containing protein [Lichenihabitans sp. Uapishka_5]MDX7952432.1 VPA1262 family N-terminal domain-containing protein [Lichenihabitans sp. Uapishka_5]